MPIELTPTSETTDTTPPTTTADDVVGDYMDLMADQDFRKSWREGSNAAEHLTPAELRDLYRLKKEQLSDATRASTGIFRKIID
jgi:hypothetical protein